MSRSLWRRLAVVTSVAASAAVPVASQQFRATVELVHIPVVVSDRSGQVVAGLTLEDFDVFEDGRPQKVAYFAEGAVNDALPLRLGLLLDSSESMELDLKAASNAAVRFVDQLVEARDVTFVEFATGIQLSRFSPQSFPMLFERIRDRQSGGSTALYDALFRYVNSTFDRTGQHVVLLHTDGGDSTSSRTFGDLQKLLRTANVLVYVVGYLEHQSGSARIAQQMRVTQIARETGGEAFFPGSPSDIDGIYDRIRAEIAGRYTLGYVPSGSRADGRFHKVEVRLTDARRRSLKVRARSGYLIPAVTDGRR
jgi:Ca-activated chloride channel family protein